MKRQGGSRSGVTKQSSTIKHTQTEFLVVLWEKEVDALGSGGVMTDQADDYVIS
jgi:hypothetical protein